MYHMCTYTIYICCLHPKPRQPRAHPNNAFFHATLRRPMANVMILHLLARKLKVPEALNHIFLSAPKANGAM